MQLGGRGVRACPDYDRRPPGVHRDMRRGRGHLSRSARRPLDHRVGIVRRVAAPRRESDGRNQVVIASGPRPVRAPRGSELTCRGWPQEAALRMLMNNLDPEVAENPNELVVYGGTGRAARSWEAFDAIVRELRNLADDETLLVQSGKPVGKFRTHDEAPRVLIANSTLVGQWNK